MITIDFGSNVPRVKLPPKTPTIYPENDRKWSKVSEGNYMSNQQKRVFQLNPEASASANSAIRAHLQVLRGELIVPARGSVCQREGSLGRFHQPAIPLGGCKALWNQHRVMTYLL